MLETTLRGYSCLTVGDTMCVHYNNRKYFIDVVEAQPSDAICIIDTDCEVRMCTLLDRPHLCSCSMGRVFRFWDLCSQTERLSPTGCLLCSGGILVREAKAACTISIAYNQSVLLAYATHRQSRDTNLTVLSRLSGLSPSNGLTLTCCSSGVVVCYQCSWP